jgi:hypothetical protein
MIIQKITHNTDISYILINNDKQIGFIDIIINYNDNTATIIDFLCINQNNGNGTILLNFIIEEMKKLKIKSILLDDMTDRYRDIHNIYLKFNFIYIHENGPEMELILNKK